MEDLYKRVKQAEQILKEEKILYLWKECKGENVKVIITDTGVDDYMKVKYYFDKEDDFLKKTKEILIDKSYFKYHNMLEDLIINSGYTIIEKEN